MNDYVLDDSPLLRDCLHLELFAHGQTYVALSRCASLEGLYLTSSICPEDIIIDQEIIEFMKNVTVVAHSKN